MYFAKRGSMKYLKYLVGLFFLLQYSSFATVYYVDKDNKYGNGSNNGWPGTITQPKADLSGDWFRRNLEPGDTVRIAQAASYGEIRLYNTSSGTAANPVVIMPWAAGDTIISNNSSFGIRLLANTEYMEFNGPFEFINVGKPIGLEFAGVKTGIKVNNAKVHGTAGSTNYYGITIEGGAVDCEFKDIIIYDIGRQGVRCGIGSSDTPNNNILFENVEVYNVNNSSDQGNSDGFVIWKSDAITFRNCSSHDNYGNGFELQCSAVLENCKVYNNRDNGIRIYRDNRDSYAEKQVTIINGLIYNNSGTSSKSGIQVSNGASLQLCNSVLYNNQAQGVAIAGIAISNGPSSVNSILVNNIIAENGTEGINVVQSGANSNVVDADYNVYYNNTNANSGLNTDTHVTIGNPNFIDALGGNFRLSSGSTAINVGMDNTAYQTFNSTYGIDLTSDFDGNTRPFNNIFDAGAYESSEVGPTNPDAPGSLTAVTVSENSIDLTWIDNSDNEDGFKIESSLDGSTGWTQITSVPANAITYSDGGLSCETAYYYRVRAYNIAGNSAYTNVSNATTDTCPIVTVPLSPSGPTAIAVSASSIDLSWTDNADNEDNFKIESSPDGSTDWVEIATVSANTTVYTNNGLSCGITYYYRVLASNTSGNSEYSNISNATTDACVGNVYYVDKANKLGNGSNNSWPGTIDQPKNDVDADWFRYNLQPGDTVILLQSDIDAYGRMLITNTAGTVENPIVVMPFPGDTIKLFPPHTGGSEAIRLQENVSYINFLGPILCKEKSIPLLAEKHNVGIKITDMEIIDCDKGISLSGARDCKFTNITITDVFNIGAQCRGSESAATGDPCENILFENVHIKDIDDLKSGPENSDADGFHTFFGENIRFINCSVENGTEDGFDVNANAIMINCRVNNMEGAGVKVWRRQYDNYAEKTLTMINCVISNTGFYAPNPSDGNPGIKVINGAGLNIYNSVIYNGYDQGIQGRYSSSDPVPANEFLSIKVYNTTIANTANGPGINDMNNLVQADYNLYYNNVKDAAGFTIGSNSITGMNPQFIDEFNADFRIQSGSPTIDAGTDLTSDPVYNKYGLTDITGETRPNGSAVDIGAYEASDSGIPIPDAPGGLTAAAASDSSITLTWVDNSNIEESFKLEHSLNDSSDWVQIATVPTNTTTYTDNTLFCGTNYFYRVRAYSVSGNSAYSSVASAQTNDCPPSAYPLAPTNLSATLASEGSIDLNWTDNADNEDSFKIESSPNGNSNWTEIATVSANTVVYTNSGLKCGLAFYYRIRALNMAGYSVYSDTATASTDTCTSRVYYVDKANKLGNGSNESWPGTIDQPKSDVDTDWFRNQLNPGDTVIILQSDADAYGRMLMTNSTGTSQNPIVVKAFPGDTIKFFAPHTGGSEAIRLQDNVSYIHFEGPIKITGKSTPLLFEGLNAGITMNNVEIIDCDRGMQLYGGIDCEFKNMTITDVLEFGIGLRGSTGTATGDPCRNILMENIHVKDIDDNKSGPENSDADGFHTYFGENIRFINCSAENGSEDGFDINANAIMINCRVNNMDGAGVKVWRRLYDNYAEKTVTMINCVIANSGYYAPDPSDGNPGIKVSYGAGLNIYNSVVYNGYDQGIQGRYSSSDPVPANEFLPIKVYNTIIASTAGGTGINDMNNLVEADYNLYYNNVQDVAGFTMGSNSIAGVDPLFTDVSNNDYGIQEGSPAVNVGTNLVGTDSLYGIYGHTDFAGIARPSGSGIEIGAYECEGCVIREPGEVRIVDNWLLGLSHPAEAGTDRLLVFTAHYENNKNYDIVVNSVTYGGQSMTKVIEKQEGTNSDVYVAAFILNDSGITAATNSKFDVVLSGEPSKAADYASVFLTGVDQSASIGATGSNSGTGETLTTSSLATMEGDMVIVVGTSDKKDDYFVNNDFIEGIELSPQAADGVAGYKAATEVAETPSITHAKAKLQVIIGFVVKAGEIVLSKNTAGSEVEAAVLPEEFTLYNAYPNPFNPATNVRFDLPEYASVTLSIYNSLGELVRTLISGDYMRRGSYQYVWNGRNDSSNQLSSGIYLIMIQAGKYQSVRKIILMK